MRVQWTIRGRLNTETDIGELSPEDLISGRIESWRVWTTDTTVETVAEEVKTPKHFPKLPPDSLPRVELKRPVRKQ